MKPCTNCDCYKELLHRLKLINIIAFLNEPKAKIAQKLYIRELWAANNVECAGDWIVIYRGLFNN